MDSSKRLYLGNNQLGGAIPAELEELNRVEKLYLVGNNWSGCILARLENVENNALAQAFLVLFEGRQL